MRREKGLNRLICMEDMYRPENQEKRVSKLLDPYVIIEELTILTVTEPFLVLTRARFPQLGFLFGLSPFAICGAFKAAIKSLAVLVSPHEPRPGV